jgi:hypothetical protein
MEVLEGYAPPEISEMVERYWADPDKHFDEMLEMVFDFMKSTYRKIGYLDD